MAVQIKHLMLFLAISFLIFCAPKVLSQNFESETLPLNKQYKTWVSLNRSPYEVSGYLSQISDPSVIDQEWYSWRVRSSDQRDDTIRVRKKYAPRVGAKIGAVIDPLIGAVINSQSADNFFTTGEKALLGAAGDFFPGALLGRALGAFF